MSDATINAGVGGPKLDPESLLLRGRPRPVARFKRHVVIGILGVAAIGIFVATWLALKASPLARPTSGGELYNIDRKPTADGLAGLPSGYDKMKPALVLLSRAILGRPSCARAMVLVCPWPARRAKTTRRAPRNCIWPSWRGRPTRATCSSKPEQAMRAELMPRQ